MPVMAAMLGTLALLALPGLQAQAGAATGARACAALAGRTLEAASIGLPTHGATLQRASWRTATQAVAAAYCEVQGAVLPVDPTAPPIRFEVNLPAHWNGKLLQLGGGGFDGTLVTGLQPPPGTRSDAPAAIAEGYVTLGSDSGHEGHGAFDASFALNAEAFHNFGGDQIKKTHDVAVQIVRRFYGRLPTHSYFLGGSQGGHEGLIAAQRFPQDYDGVVALYPAYNIALLHLGANAFAKALYAHGGAGWLDPAKVALLQRAVYRTCDGLDGARDGLIGNLPACRRAFRIGSLRCPGGVDRGDGCLSDAQIAAVQTIAAPFRLDFVLPDGQQVFPRWTILEGAEFLTSLGQSRIPSHPPARGDALQYAIADTTVRYIFTANPAIDSIDGFRADDYRERILHAAQVLDDARSNLDAFRDRGGKLILLHGTADELITPYNTVDYWQRLVDRYSERGLQGFARFYWVPGYGHGRGLFDARWRPLQVLDAWVTQGRAPGTPIAIDGNPGAHRSRPLCRYPDWPRYDGHGDLNAASSFQCSHEGVVP